MDLGGVMSGVLGVWNTPQGTGYGGPSLENCLFFHILKRVITHFQSLKC